MECRLEFENVRRRQRSKITDRVPRVPVLRDTLAQTIRILGYRSLYWLSMKTFRPARNLWLTVLMMSLIVVASSPTQGQGIPGYSDDIRYAFDPREIALLPPYCIYTQVFRDNVPGANDPAEI